MTQDNKLVLIVDDTPTNVGVISGVLKGAYRTKVATNGEKALVLASAPEKPDLILLDVMMPGMDGYEVCRRLKANPVTRDIPVIFLTAKTDAIDEENGFEVGAVDYIHKPFSGPIVLARVKTQLALQAALAQAREARNQADELLHALLPKKAAECDQPIAALLTDLRERQLLEDTLVIWGGEFGRMPRKQLPTADIKASTPPGRDHNARGFCCWLAGGGVKGGVTHGATDELGFYAAEHPHYVTDIHATALHQLGLDPLALEVPGRRRLEIDLGHPIKEILA